MRRGRDSVTGLALRARRRPPLGTPPRGRPACLRVRILVQSHLFAPKRVGTEQMAEREGFEPSRPFGLTVFKTAAFDHSATSPSALHSKRCRSIYKKKRGEKRSFSSLNEPNAIL